MGNIKNVLISSILAGFCITIGGAIFLSIDNKIIGSLLFSLGLFCVCSASLNLFTGKICYISTFPKNEWYKYIFILCGNALGAFICATLLSFTRYFETLNAKAINICDVKLSDSYISLIILGFFCNIFIFIAVDGYKNIKYEIGKYIAIIFGVMGFILIGSEHCVADMFYVFMAQKYSIEMFKVLLFVIIGNILGGICSYSVLTNTNKLKS